MRQEELPTILEDLETKDPAACHRAVHKFAQKRLPRPSSIMLLIVARLVEFGKRPDIRSSPIIHTLCRVLRCVREVDLAPLFLKLSEEPPPLKGVDEVLRNICKQERLSSEAGLQFIIVLIPRGRRYLNMISGLIDRFHMDFTANQIQDLVDSLVAAVRGGRVPQTWSTFEKLCPHFNSRHCDSLNSMLLCMKLSKAEGAIRDLFGPHILSREGYALDAEGMTYQIMESQLNSSYWGFETLLYLLKSQKTVDPLLLSKLSLLCAGSLVPQGHPYRHGLKGEALNLVKVIRFAHELLHRHQTIEWPAVIFEAILICMKDGILTTSCFLLLARVAFEIPSWLWEQPARTENRPSPAKLLDTFSRTAFWRLKRKQWDWDDAEFQEFLSIVLLPLSLHMFSKLLSDPQSLYWRRIDPIIGRAFNADKLEDEMPVEVRALLPQLEAKGSWVGKLLRPAPQD